MPGHDKYKYLACFVYSSKAFLDITIIYQQPVQKKQENFYNDRKFLSFGIVSWKISKGFGCIFHEASIYCKKLTLQNTVKYNKRGGINNMKNFPEIKTRRTEDSITIYWEKPEFAGNCQYEAFLDGKKSGSTDKTHYTFEGLTADREYEIEVRSCARERMLYYPGKQRKSEPCRQKGGLM